MLKPKQAKIIDRKGEEGIGCKCPEGYSVNVVERGNDTQELHCCGCGALWKLVFLGFFETSRHKEEDTR